MDNKPQTIYIEVKEKTDMYVKAWNENLTFTTTFVEAQTGYFFTADALRKVLGETYTAAFANGMANPLDGQDTPPVHEAMEEYKNQFAALTQPAPVSDAQQERNKIDCNVFIDRAIAMLKDEYKDNFLVAGYNGITSLLQYAKESHTASHPQVQGEEWQAVPDEIKKYISDSLKETISIYGEVVKVATYGGSTMAIFKNGICYRINYSSYNSQVTLD